MRRYAALHGAAAVPGHPNGQRSQPGPACR